MTPPLIRPLDETADAALVDAFWDSCADYIALERITATPKVLTHEFFHDAPPGADPAASLRLGLFVDGVLAGVSETGFGFPEVSDAYLGLMVLGAKARGGGYGAAFLHWIEQACRLRGAQRLYLGVLVANPRGRAFWAAQGFVATGPLRDITLGDLTQPAQRMVKTL